MRILFGECSIDVERRELRRAGKPVHVEPQVFDLIFYLVRHRDRVVSKDQLLDAVWQGRVVRNPHSARASMPPGRPSATAAKCRFIQTLPGVDFGLSLPSRRRSICGRDCFRHADGGASADRPERHPSRYCPSTIREARPMRVYFAEGMAEASSPASRISAGSP